VLDAIDAQQMKVDWMEFIQTLLDSTDWPGAQKFIVKMTDDDRKRQQQKSEQAMQTNQIALKHQATMQEIEKKGLAQSGTHIIRGLVEQMNPANRMQVLAQLKDLFTPPEQDQGMQTEPGGGQPGTPPPMGQAPS
jgi:hypothetical protein